MTGKIGRNDEGYVTPTHTLLKTKSQIEGIRESGKINIEIQYGVSKDFYRLKK